MTDNVYKFHVGLDVLISKNKLLYILRSGQIAT